MTILTLVISPDSLMTVGVTSSLSRASLNWTCVPAELTVAYGLSAPREIVALAFSVVTTSGFESDVVLFSASRASRTRLMLSLRLMSPKAMLAGVAKVPGRIGKLTMLPPSGRPVVPLTGRKVLVLDPGGFCPGRKPGLFAGSLKKTGGMPPDGAMIGGIVPAVLC